MNRAATKDELLALISGLGFSPEDVLHRYMEYEGAWLAAMKPRSRWFR
jgi:hypothetical protein